MKNLYFIGIGVVIIGIASAERASSNPSAAVSNSDIEIDYECEFTSADLDCEVEGEIEFEGGDMGLTERDRADASFDLRCVSKKGSFRIHDRHAEVNREGDDLEISGRDDGQHATVRIEDLLEARAARRDFDAKLKVNGSVLEGSCEIEIDRDNTGTGTSTGTQTITETITQVTTY